MRTLLLAWAGTLVFLGTVAVWMQLSYEPPKKPVVVSMDDPRSRNADAPTGHTSSETDPATSTATSGNIDARAGMPQSEESSAIARDDAITRPAFGDPQDTVPQGTVPDEAADSISDIVTDAPAAAYADIPVGPDAALIEDGPYGPLPITWNQRQPWQVYARPFNKPGDRPRIAIVIVGLGLSAERTQRAIDTLPADVTLAFSPYGQDLQSMADTARQAGHESLVMVPMEPLDYPVNDPGPRGLLTSATAQQNEDNLHYILSRMQGYVGLVNDMGSKYTADPAAMAIVMQDIQRRGLVFLDAHTSRLTVAATSAREYGVPRALNDRYIDNNVSPAQINRYLRELENIAVRNGVAVGIGRHYPVTLDQIAAWAPTLAAKGIDLAPISAVANRQVLR